ncbi:AMP-binding protein, partial [Desulfobacterales bacterium HSG16]|nr:AMP-binding protein [Desulfobacterales bacterium HSG16]
SQGISMCTKLAQAKAMIFGEEFIERIEPAKAVLDQSVSHYLFVGPESKVPKWAGSFSKETESASDDDPCVDIQLTDGAGLYFTSGTTGKPKGVLLTHRNLEFSCYAENRHHNQTHEDNFLCIPPLYHTGAKMHWFGNFIVGAKSVILKGVKPKWIIEAISEEKITMVWLLVPWAHDILIAIEEREIDLDDYKLDQWRFMHIGAQPVPPSLVRKWKTVFPHHAYDTNYGLTESTGPGCVHLGIENIHKVGSIGLPGFDWECRIIDHTAKTFKFEQVPDGEPGELIIKGPGVMQEYYRNPEATASTLVNGWLLTGDVARRDEDGFIWLVDRKKDVIITGGENIYPVEIEDFMMENPSVHDVAAFGIPNERLGEIVGMVIKVKSSCEMSEDEVRTFCEDMPRFKRPKKIFFDDVPRNPTGKIEKPLL